MKNILVTIDFNKNVELLIDKAFELAEMFKSKIWLMHIAEEADTVGYGVGPQVGYVVGPLYIRDFKTKDFKKEHRLLQGYVDKLQKKGIHAEGLLMHGATIEMIIGESKKLNIDLIIAGHHKHGFIYNAFIGSVSEQIIKKSKIPILIVPFE